MLWSKVLQLKRILSRWGLEIKRLWIKIEWIKKSKIKINIRGIRGVYWGIKIRSKNGGNNKLK